MQKIRYISLSYMVDYHSLDPKHTRPERLRKERQKARLLKQTSWWKAKLQLGICAYCEKKVDALTMDHVIPLARGGSSVKSNIVPACFACNQGKKLESPLDSIFARLAKDLDDSDLRD